MLAAISHNLDEGRYKNAVLYFIKYCNNKYLGLTKLNKLFYYLDFVSFRDTGKSVTGDTYIHQQFGPVPAHLDEILASLKKENKIDARSISVNHDKEKIEFDLVDDIAPDESVFTGDQKAVLKAICDEFGSWSTEKIVSQTHLEAPWFFSKPLEEVDYHYSKDIEFFQKA